MRLFYFENIYFQFAASIHIYIYIRFKLIIYTCLNNIYGDLLGINNLKKGFIILLIALHNKRPRFIYL